MSLPVELALEIEKRFSLHSPSTTEVSALHDGVRSILKKAVIDVLDLLPYGPEVEEVARLVVKLDEAMMWAQAAVARYQGISPKQAPAPPPAQLNQLPAPLPPPQNTPLTGVNAPPPSSTDAAPAPTPPEAGQTVPETPPGPATVQSPAPASEPQAAGGEAVAGAAPPAPAQPSIP